MTNLLQVIWRKINSQVSECKTESHNVYLLRYLVSLRMEFYNYIKYKMKPKRDHNSVHKS